eukprot:m.19199 g.19199  ORF g.19199 m.19199 type:complete len:244 (-) comp6508_c0_seq1:615-1346(-)
MMDNNPFLSESFQGEHEQLHLSVTPPERVLGKKNLPERIMFAVDVSHEGNRTTEHDDSTIFHIKAALKMFVKTKSMFNSKHMFAVSCMLEKSAVLYDFTTDTESIIETIDQLDSQGSCVSLDLSSIASDIVGRMGKEDETVTRLILICTRPGKCFWSDIENWNKLISRENFFCDSIIIGSPSDRIQGIKEVLKAIDPKATRSYVHMIEREKILSSMATLLAHPSLRSTQSMASYSLDAKEEEY